MFNIYPKRLTNPKELDLFINDRLRKENIKLLNIIYIVREKSKNMGCLGKQYRNKKIFKRLFI